MAENRFCGGGRDTVCIEADRVLDSCRDRDCYENTRVFLTDFGQEIIEHTGNVRIKRAHITGANISIDPVQFNRGFFSVTIRFFIHLECEACVGGRNQEFDGVTAVEKKVILFGGESCTGIFRSSVGEDICRCDPHGEHEHTPTATVEVAAPVVLDSRVMDCCKCGCGVLCCADEIPEDVCRCVNGSFFRGHCERVLTVSLGIFSVVRITRPAQYLISATEYSVPDKECVGNEERNACSLFRSMAFPVGDFSTSSFTPPPASERPCGCRGD
ncbi:MAG: hypothetical protein ACI4QZ_04410 [Eubacteriales bacterium]